MSNIENRNKILVAICGLGEPKFNTKLHICLNNIENISNQISVNYKIFCYDKSVTTQFDHVQNCEIIHEKGFIGEFIFRHLHPKVIAKYDRVILLLDDVELKTDVNLHQMIYLQDEYAFDVVSPTLTHDSKWSHPFMLTKQGPKWLDYKNTVSSVDFLEFFCYMFKPSTLGYSKWFSMFDKKTKYMWGMDLFMHSIFNMKLGLINDMTMKHHEKGNCYNESDSMLEQARLEKRFNRKIIWGSGFSELERYSYNDMS